MVCFVQLGAPAPLEELRDSCCSDKVTTSALPPITGRSGEAHFAKGAPMVFKNWGCWLLFRSIWSAAILAQLITRCV